MSDDDVEMVDVIATPSDTENVSGEPHNENKNELDAATRVDQLCALDEQIVSILAKGAAIVESISAGKLSGNAMDKRDQFKQAINDYNYVVEEVNKKLRREVELLHSASHSKLLPLYIPIQASSLGEEKERILLESLQRKANLN